MKRIVCLILACMLFLTACGIKAEVLTWQEQYDLGVRYLSEGNYEEAILAFNAAIEIDPMQALAFVARADAYMNATEEQYDMAEQDYLKAIELDGSVAETYLKLAELYILLEDTEAAIAILEQGAAITGNPDLGDLSALRTAYWQEKLLPAVYELDLPMTVDSVVLGQTGIDTAIAAYQDYPYAEANLMNEGTSDTVYTCFGMNDTPIPEGHSEMEFGFLFAGVPGGVVDDIYIAQPGLTALGCLMVEDDASKVLNLLQFPAENPIADLKWTLKNGAILEYSSKSLGNFSVKYRPSGFSEGTGAQIYVKDGRIHSINFDAN